MIYFIPLQNFWDGSRQSRNPVNVTYSERERRYARAFGTSRRHRRRRCFRVVKLKYDALIFLNSFVVHWVSGTTSVEKPQKKVDAQILLEGPFKRRCTGQTHSLWVQLPLLGIPPSPDPVTLPARALLTPARGTATCSAVRHALWLAGFATQSTKTDAAFRKVVEAG